MKQFMIRYSVFAGVVCLVKNSTFILDAETFEHARELVKAHIKRNYPDAQFALEILELEQ